MKPIDLFLQCFWTILPLAIVLVGGKEIKNGRLKYLLPCPSAGAPDPRARVIEYPRILAWLVHIQRIVFAFAIVKQIKD